MTIIVEDGSIVSGANSYLSTLDANAILADFGYSALPATTAESCLKVAAQYLESYRMSFKGYKVSSSQKLQFPRYDVYIDGFLFSSDKIPEQLKIAQALAAYEKSQGNELLINNDSKIVVSESVASLSVTYSDNGIGNAQPSFGMIDAQLQSLLKTSSQFRTLRV